MSRIRRRPGVDEDIFEQALYLAVRSEDAGYRFLQAVEQSLHTLADMPGIGSPKGMADPLLTEVRTWKVKGFRNHLIYYVARDFGIDVLALLHGHQLPGKTLRRRIRGKP